MQTNIDMSSWDNNKESYLDDVTSGSKKIIIDWGEGTASHGIPRIIQTNSRVIKLLWTVFVVLSFSYCIYTLVQTFTQYFSYPTSRQISIVRDDLTEFPAVTICNLSPYNYFAKSKLIDPILVKYNITYGRDWTQIDNANDPLRLYKNFFTKLNAIISADFNETFRQSLGFDLEKEMLLSCSYNKKPCKASDFTYSWSTKYGNCYTFNTNKYTNGTDKNILLTSRTGRDYGLKLELLIGNPLGFGSTGLLSFLTEKNGIYVGVHKNNEPPSFFTNGFTVPSGTDAYVPIKRTLYQKEAKPYSNCLKSLDDFSNVNDYSQILYTYMQSLNLTDYMQNACYRLCLQDQLVNACDCCDTNMPLIRNKTYCRSNAEIDCLTNATATFVTSNVDQLCHYACAPQCFDMKYSYTEYYSAYPVDFYLGQMINASNYLDSTSAFQIMKLAFRGLLAGPFFGQEQALSLAKEMMVKVTINYEDLTYKLIDDQPLITLETLFGILGGQVGLFIGLSFLSLVEFLELFIRFIQLIIGAFKRNDKKHDLSWNPQFKPNFFYISNYQ